ncbi:hypothetical protein [Chloroflexus sp.]|uniref:hypothetical protein n=1 Tax=Chloroflexus sp. TaxID=1904827 RepID=UPI002ADD5C72|nr:hypothetical protein [Chloroflexus sp.]
MTAARRTPYTLPQIPFTGNHSLPAEIADPAWPLAFKALLLLNGATSVHDQLLASLSEADLVALRGSLLLLQHDEPTNIA